MDSRLDETPDVTLQHHNSLVTDVTSVTNVTNDKTKQTDREHTMTTVNNYTNDKEKTMTTPQDDDTNADYANDADNADDADSGNGGIDEAEAEVDNQNEAHSKMAGEEVPVTPEASFVSDLANEDDRQQEEEREDEIARLAERIEHMREKADTRRADFSVRLDLVQERWRKVEERRKARTDYYHAKIHDHQLLNPTLH